MAVSQIMSLQYSPTEVSEDCLYLNVYAPAQAQRGDRLPVRCPAGLKDSGQLFFLFPHICLFQVMVWIHGGGLAMGAASQFDGAPLAAYENIITVIIQYRLGILGFLR